MSGLLLHRRRRRRLGRRRLHGLRLCALRRRQRRWLRYGVLSTLLALSGLVILAPHLTSLSKKELGLPSWDKASERQRAEGMAYSFAPYSNAVGSVMVKADSGIRSVAAGSVGPAGNGSSKARSAATAATLSAWMGTCVRAWRQRVEATSAAPGARVQAQAGPQHLRWHSPPRQ